MKRVTNRIVNCVAVSVAALAAACLLAAAQDKHEDHAGPAPAHPQLEKIKKLAGTWNGKADSTHSMVEDVTVIYRVTAGGSAVMETLFPGTEHEMITMYHADGDDLVLTHYCTMGNQPRMKARPATEPNIISFACMGGTNMKSEDDPHMHSQTLTLVDDDHIRSVWSMHEAGKPQHEARFDLTRAKP